MNEFEIALAIYNRHSRRRASCEILAFVQEVQNDQNDIKEFESVSYLYDCFKRAMQKVTKAKSFEAKITKNWKDYNKFVELIGLVKEHHINPFVFFYFKIQDLRDKKIFPKISNVVTKKAVEHFLGWRKKNQYKVSVITQEKTYEQEWLNQLSLDVQSLVTYELRKPVVSLMKPEGFIFSGLGKCLLNHFQHIGFTVDSEESQHWSELVANETLFRKALEHWNGCLSKEALKLGSLYHSMRDRKFIEKLDALTKLLSVLKVAIP